MTWPQALVIIAQWIVGGFVALGIILWLTWLLIRALS
jgi:hypothetical protein